MVLTNWLDDAVPNGASWAFERGDVLFGKLRPYFRKVGVAPIPGRATREIVVLRPREERAFGLVIGVVASQSFIDFCTTASSGTRMPRAEWKDVRRFALGLPNPQRLEHLTSVARANYEAIGGLTLVTRSLESIRDALLPKLVSGQIRVPLSNHPVDQAGAAVEANSE